MEKKHKPCKHRRREMVDGVALDMCYAIGIERIGDMPCEYCNEWDKEGHDAQEKYYKKVIAKAESKARRSAKAVRHS